MSFLPLLLLRITWQADDQWSKESGVCRSISTAGRGHRPAGAKQERWLETLQLVGCQTLLKPSIIPVNELYVELRGLRTVKLNFRADGVCVLQPRPVVFLSDGEDPLSHLKHFL